MLLKAKKVHWGEEQLFVCLFFLVCQDKVLHLRPAPGGDEEKEERQNIAVLCSRKHHAHEELVYCIYFS